MYYMKWAKKVRWCKCKNQVLLKDHNDFNKLRSAAQALENMDDADLGLYLQRWSDSSQRAPNVA